MKSTKVLAKSVLQAEDNTVLLLKRSETDDRRPLQWDFPGGGVDDSEDFVAAAIRETREEAGISIAHADLSLAYTLTKIGVVGNICWLIFVGKVKKQKVELSFEHCEYKWVSLDEAIKLVEYKLQKDALIHIKQNGLLD